MFRKRSLPAQVTDLHDSTTMDARGSVTSIQSANVRLDSDALSMIWSEHWLERLARSYWAYLSKFTLGLIRVHYSPRGREVVLLFKPLRLLTFSPPEYELDSRHGSVTWGIARGLLVATPNQGLLRITVTRPQGDTPDPFAEPPAANTAGAIESVRVDVEVSNFYPAIAAKLSDHLYRWTQSAIHVIVTYGFLRSLAHGELEESKAGRFARPSSPN
jgi:hypothetical protein